MSTKVANRCGDGLCDGLENPNNCLEDCSVQVSSPHDRGDEVDSGLDQREASDWVTNQSSGNRIFVAVIYPDGWSGRISLSWSLFLEVVGIVPIFSDRLDTPASTLANAGYLVVVFDPEGRGKSEGQEDYNVAIHQDGLADVIHFASGLSEARYGLVGLVSSSYGVTMASGSLARHPDLPVAFLISVYNSRRITPNLILIMPSR